jgi:hypothetical protein
MQVFASVSVIFLALIFAWPLQYLTHLFLSVYNSLSLFDFKRHGNRNYGSPFNALKGLRSSQGKMEKSFLRYMQFQIFLLLFY